jgi:predicted AlkP superfamily phosphohydrolase/phosphomutase
MRSVTPPITVPAWMCMMTGCDPGQLGVYGFRNRSDYSYDKLAIANSTNITEPTVWDILSRNGKNSIIIGVPPSYPVKPIRGTVVSCFLTPTADSQFTYPYELGDEIRRLVGDYMVDVKGFRTDKKDWLLNQIYEMTTKRFTVAKHLLKTRPWDLFVMVEMGTDRIHHGFWHYMDAYHVLYPGANPFEHAIRDYYIYVDSLVGELLDFADEHTDVMIVSDHGAKRMDGAICLNEWLIQNGYLVLTKYPAQPARFENVAVDWSRTRAWAEGGYYGRIFLNVAGRERQGVVAASEYDRTCRMLKEQLESIQDPDGRPMRTRAVISKEGYRETANIAPDLSVFFGDLFWRASGSVGGGQIYTRNNDTGPDGANHDWNGVFMVAPGSGTGSQTRGELKTSSLLDVAPTILDIFGLTPLPRMHGRRITADRSFGGSAAAVDLHNHGMEVRVLS